MPVSCTRNNKFMKKWLFSGLVHNPFFTKRTFLDNWKKNFQKYLLDCKLIKLNCLLGEKKSVSLFIKHRTLRLLIRHFYVVIRYGNMIVG